MNNIKHLYVHIPFCKSICFYCDFVHQIYNDNIVNEYLISLKKELDFYHLNDLETIYIGGGTPSCLNNDQLDLLLSYFKEYKPLEYTIEINPETLDLNKVLILKKYGINRVSIGLQSSNDNYLKLMNRHHTYNDVVNCIKLLRDNGINNISIDIMYSLPNQDIQDLDKTLNDVLKLDVPHISLYSLTIEDNTVFKLKNYKPCDEDLEADMYEYIEDKLLSNNYIHYEVSNYCKEGYESKHNKAYWLYKDYLGIGAGASSKIGNHRYTNTFNIKDYIKDYSLKEEDLILNNDDLIFENIMMNLRIKQGINIAEFNKKYNIDLIKKLTSVLNKYESVLIVKNGQLYVKNYEILNSILVDIL